jgi:transcriptional regulator
MVKSVVAFAMPIERLDGKFKLSQNRPAGDLPGIVGALQDSGDSGACGVADLMRQQFPGLDDGPT